MFLTQSDYDKDSSSGSVWFSEGFTLWSWIIISVVTLIVLGALIFLFYKTYSSCRKKSCNDADMLTCYLCVRRVTISSWRQGTHQQKCAELNKDILNRMKSPESSKIRSRLELMDLNLLKFQLISGVPVVEQG